MAGKKVTVKNIAKRIMETISELNRTEEELKQELMATEAKKNTLLSFLNMDDPGERILDILFNPTKVLFPGTRKKRVAKAHADEKPYSDITLGAAVCAEMNKEHNRKRRTPSEVAEKIVEGGWRGRKGRSTAEKIRPKVSEILNSGHKGRTFKKVSRGVFTV